MSDAAERAPSGTVTFLFSDVVGSTRLWAADSDAMAASLRLHDAIVREVALEHSGYVFSTAGDSFAIAFARPTAAAACAADLANALAAARWDGGPALAIRLGMHLGEAEERDGNYFGSAVNLAARVMAAAHGGQCLMTRGVADALEVQTRDLGEHRLRDIEAPVRLHQLGSDDFPPLFSATAGIVVLPSPRTSLVGRDDDIAQVRRFLAEHRLVTLTGVGGCGKTRLAIEVARQEVPSFPDGVWFADLSTVASDEDIYSVFASTFDVVIADRAAAQSRLTEYLAPRDALLVVDNCEHVIEEVAEFVDELLSSCGALRIIATSRESLEVDGERAWKVPSLSADEGGAAVELFLERAAANDAPIGDDPADRAAVTTIVAHLDGVPLAIELAAARTRSMSVTEIRDRLDDRFRILAGGKRRSRQRQATLEAAVQWSYDLLSEREQRALQELAVFQSGFDLADAAAVLDSDDATAADLVDALVAKSLVDVTRDARGTLRHRLLETIRLFGLARLVAAGRADAVRDRHLEHFHNDRVSTSMSVWLSLDSLERIDREYENMRAAAEWALERGRPEAAVKIAAMLSDAAPPRGDFGTISEWLQLSSPLAGRDLVFAQALLGHALNINGQPQRAMEFLGQAVALGESLGCDDTIFARLDVAVATGFTDLRSAVDMYDTTIRDSTREFGAAHVTTCAAMFAMLTLVSLGDYQRVLELAGGCADQLPTFGYRHIVEAWSAYALLMLGRIDAARAAVDTFVPVPASSQWKVMNLVVEHLVLAATDGEERALRALAPKAAESVSRQPLLAGDMITTIALLELRLGDATRSAAARDMQTFGSGAVQIQLACELDGTPDLDVAGRTAMFESEVARYPTAQRWHNTFQHAPGHLADAITRWS